MVPSGHDKAIVLMNPQLLELPAKDMWFWPCKFKSVNISTWKGLSREPKPVAEEVWLMDAREKSQFFFSRNVA